ncbi:hypothetical protein GNI_141770 [Gregarina niphandrodes]|uniref:Uncharacterized protein n=1 Tax=Gregarina niphandrodes TaxID=110365 RepID=A0A023B0H7_GRENI|nr:hypothetical protein GNI_141770 [Gregarina niphandrodes]EZG45002.1 hypothetical protein GNI_141770 [Gregarina niphandrodes]|eukprot:XP_011132601.1 hypothetical protein GNI_141770 [Gregarina niphandrodes]
MYGGAVMSHVMMAARQLYGGGSDVITEGSEGFYPNFGLQSTIPTWRLEGMNDVLVKLGRNMEMFLCCCEGKILDLTRCLFIVRSVDELNGIATVINSYITWVLDTQTHAGADQYQEFRLANDSIQYELYCNAALWSTASASVRLDDLLILDDEIGPSSLVTAVGNNWGVGTTISARRTDNRFDEDGNNTHAHSRDYLLSIKYLMSFARPHSDLESASSLTIFVK